MRKVGLAAIFGCAMVAECNNDFFNNDIDFGPREPPKRQAVVYEYEKPRKLTPVRVVEYEVAEPVRQLRRVAQPVTLFDDGLARPRRAVLAPEPEPLILGRGPLPPPPLEYVQPAPVFRRAENDVRGFDNQSQGRDNYVRGYRNGAYGFENEVVGVKNQAFGVQNKLQGHSNVAHGALNEAYGKGNALIGIQNQASGSNNKLEGVFNKVQGLGNSVSGTGNIVRGSGSRC